MSDFLKPQSPLQHKDGAYIYPLTTADQVILEDNSRLNAAFENLVYVSEENQETAIVPINADTLNGQLPSYYAKATKLTPRNLLDNSDFTNPVNQRAKSVYTDANATIDRWGISANGQGAYCALTVNNGSITLNSSDGGICYLYQRLPIGVISKDKKYTAAYGLSDGSIVFHYDESISHTDNYSQVVLRVLNGKTLLWAALYEGEYTAETLPEYQPKGYGAELAECQRYWLKPVQTPVGYGYIYSAAAATCVIPLPVKMRTVPTITYNSLTVKYYNGSSATAVTVTTHVIFEAEGNALRLNLAGEFTMPGVPCVVVASNLVLNAEL